MSDLDIKKDFPIFATYPGLVFLDNAATVHKPRVVIETESNFYSTQYANIHRGTYDLAYLATEAYEGTRKKVAEFIRAATPDEIVFTANATGALNLAAHIEGQRLVAADEIILSTAAHHSHILPWMRAAKATGAKLVWLEVADDGAFPLADFKRKLNTHTKIVAIAQVTNVLGYLAPMTGIVEMAHGVGARVVMDAAQSAGRMAIDVQALGVDYAAFSGHKLYGPTGTGFLYAKEEYLRDAEPMLVGGGTIKKVTRETVEWADVPLRFEAGTPHMAGVVGLGAALDYLKTVGLDQIWEHDQELTRYALEKLDGVDGLTLYGPKTANLRAGVMSFSLSSAGRLIHSHDVAEIANGQQVAIRAGHHCAQPLMTALGVNEVTRASFGIYNEHSDIDRLVEALREARQKFA